MSNNKLWRLLALLLAFGLVAAACGSDDAETETGSDDGAEAAASSSEEAAPTCEGESDGVLTLGGILPETGNLAFLGPPEFAGAELAAFEINENGGVLGNDVVWLPGDSGDNGDVANQTVDRLLGENVDGFLGAASSGVSFTVIDKITGACKIHFSPANTSPDFTTKDPNQLYFRTAPSDVLQGRVLADLIVEEGSGTAVIMALQDPYGEGLLRYTKEPLVDQGVEVLDDFVYDPKAASFDAEVEKVVASGAEAIVVIGFDETAQILTGLFESGITPDTNTIYLVDGNVGNALGEKFSEQGVLAGIKGTLPTAELSAGFKDRLLGVDPDLIDFAYGPETYDAFIIMALAAEAAGTDDPAEIAKRINGITGGGEKCTSFADCKALIADGTDIDYDGPSGPQNFSQAGEPTEASFAILNYASDSNTIDDSLTTYKFAKIGS
ncbi:MAG: ABC transporter substrate-binding protein [Acidimicrobiales bacterium]